MAKAALTRETAAPDAGALPDIHLALRGVSHTYPARAAQGAVPALGLLATRAMVSSLLSMGTVSAPAWITRAFDLARSMI